MDVSIARLPRRSFSRSASPHGRTAKTPCGRTSSERRQQQRTQVEQIYHNEEGCLLLPRSNTVLGYLSRKPRFTFVTSASIERDREKETRDRDGRDRNKEGEGGGGSGSNSATTVLPPATPKNHHTNYSSFRPMNARHNFLGGQQINPLPSQQPSSAQQQQPPQQKQQSTHTSSSNGRESEDLVAMGTNPLTGRLRPREGSFVNGGGLYMTQSSSTTGTVNSRKFPKSNGLTPTRRESEPKYADPLSGAPPSFQQRLAEITSLEQETLRYERTKKFKKKKET